MEQIAHSNRRWRLAVVGVLAAFSVTLPLVAQETGQLFSKGPYVQAGGPTSMTIMWESATNAPGLVRFGRGGKLTETLVVGPPRPMTGISTVYRTNVVSVRTDSLTVLRTNVVAPDATNLFYVYTATLENLKPGAAYTYAVELDGSRTRPRQFKTFKPNTKSVRFIAYGDSRSNPDTHAALARRFRSHAPDFVLHTGDLVGRGRDYWLWSPEFFTPLADVMAEVPLFPAIGNHEQDGTNYFAFFHLPGNERWYSFDAGPVHVLVLDYQFAQATSEQFAFARDDLMASRAPWKIVLLHCPVFNIGGHKTGWGHKDYLRLFHQAKVDLVLAGHSHIYERFRPVAARSPGDDWPLTCITTGGGGANLYPTFNHPALFAQGTLYHYLVFDVTRDTLRGQAIRADGETIDRFTWRKRNGLCAPDYLAQVYPEESLKLFYEAAPSLGGYATGVPTAEVPAKVMLKLAPRPESADPAELEISLAPESAPYYKLENGPLRALLPPKGGTNQVVWATVRAAGQTRITEDRSHDLSPPLVFQATVKAPEGQTITYGNKARITQAAKEAAGVGP